MSHVLVIEDDYFTAHLMADLALEAGATSTTLAATYKSAVAAADVVPPDVIVSDVDLPDGLGPDACTEIRAEHGDVPTIFVTGSPSGCGPCSYATAILPKPIQGSELVDAIRSVVIPLSS
jgi:DNA-binding response OmpR family regulator